VEDTYYEICVASELDEKWSGYFSPLKIKSRKDETILSGYLPDQSALYGILIKIRDMGLPLISVKQLGSQNIDAGESGK
jgi:hypothetical protein